MRLYVIERGGRTNMPGVSALCSAGMGRGWAYSNAHSSKDKLEDE